MPTKEQRLANRIFDSVEEAIDWLISPVQEIEIEPQPQKEPICPTN